VDKVAKSDVRVEQEVIRYYLHQRLKDAAKASRELVKAAHECDVAGQHRKAQGHRKRAQYWAAIASGLKWCIRTLPRS
jgi:hypothetical protein